MEKINMAVPIWKDYIVNLGTGDSIQYRITIVNTGEVIYSGKAYRKPGDTDIYARVNDICADYLSHTLPTLTDRAFTALDMPTFRVQKRVASSGGYSWTDVTSVQFYNNWSYDYGQVSNVLSAPINGHVDLRMPILYTALEMTQLQAFYRVPGGSYSRIITLQTRPASGTGTFMANAVSTFTKTILINNTLLYKVMGACFKYALYYVNAFGGWDQLLIEGNDMEVDEDTRHTREVEYVNTQIVNRGKENYVNEVKKTWTLHPGLMTEDQGLRMHHLINSTDVYLYDIANEQMIPVIVTDNTCEYKTYKNQGNRLVEYTIQVEVAQNRVRR